MDTTTIAVDHAKSVFQMAVSKKLGLSLAIIHSEMISTGCKFARIVLVPSGCLRP